MEGDSYRPPPELSTGRAIPGGQLLDRTGRRERVNPAGRIDPVAEEPGELLWRDSLGGLDEVVERPSAHSVPQVAFPDRSPEALFAEQLVHHREENHPHTVGEVGQALPA